MTSTEGYFSLASNGNINVVQASSVNYTHPYTPYVKLYSPLHSHDLEIEIKSYLCWQPFSDMFKFFKLLAWHDFNLVFKFKKVSL